MAARFTAVEAWSTAFDPWSPSGREAVCASYPGTRGAFDGLDELHPMFSGMDCAKLGILADFDPTVAMVMGGVGHDAISGAVDRRRRSSVVQWVPLCTLASRRALERL